MDNAHIDRKEKTKRIVGYILLFFLAWSARVLIFLVFDRLLPTKELRSISTNVFRLLVWVVPVFLYLYYVDKVSPLNYLKLTTNLKTGSLVSIGLLVVGVIWQMILLHFGADQIGNKIEFWGLLNAVIVPPITEEILMRGFILNKFREVTSFWRANVIAALLFVMIHWPGWILINHHDIGLMVRMSSGIFVMSILLGYILKKTNSLWPCMAYHGINNFISFS